MADTEIVEREEAFQAFNRTMSMIVDNESEEESTSELEELEDLSLDPNTALTPTKAAAYRRAMKRTKKRKSVGPEDHHKSE
jgi:hypothetical protein